MGSVSDEETDGGHSQVEISPRTLRHNGVLAGE